MENSWVAAHAFYGAVQGVGVLHVGMVVAASTITLTRS